MSTINIDFGLPGAGPTPTFSGVGAAGTWNVIDRITSAGIDNGSVLDVNGQATSVMITTSQTMFDVTPSSQPFSLIDTPLLGDYLVGNSNTFTMNISGLSDGIYSFVIYTTGRQDFPRTSTIIPDGDLSLIVTNSGIYDESLEEGVTHSTFVRSVGNTGVSFEISSSSDGFINGLQITPIPEPSATIFMGLTIAIAAFFRKR